MPTGNIKTDPDISLADLDREPGLSLADLGVIAGPIPAAAAKPEKPPVPAAPASPAPEPAPPPRAAREVQPLTGRASEKADALFEDILGSYEAAGLLVPGGADEARRLRSRRIETWPKSPAETAATAVAMLEAPDCPLRAGPRVPLNIADVASMFGHRARDPEELASAVADVATPDPARMAGAIAGRLLDGSLDHVLSRKSPLTYDAQQVLESLLEFTDELRPDLDLPELARAWQESGRGTPEQIRRSIAMKLGIDHIAAQVTRDGRPVKLSPQDPRIFRPKATMGLVNPAIGAF